MEKEGADLTFEVLDVTKGNHCEQFLMDRKRQINDLLHCMH